MKINLRDFRQSLSLMQSQMASILGMNQSNISRAELRGYHDLTYNQLHTLYEMFGRACVNKFALDKDADNESDEEEGGEPSGSSGISRMQVEALTRNQEAQAEIIRKQAEQIDRLLGIIDKLTKGDAE